MHNILSLHEYIIMPIKADQYRSMPINATSFTIDANGDQHDQLGIDWLWSALAVGHVLLVTRWLILSSTFKSLQSMMVSHRAVDHKNQDLNLGIEAQS